MCAYTLSVSVCGWVSMWPCGVWGPTVKCEQHCGLMVNGLSESACAHVQVFTVHSAMLWAVGFAREQD